MAYFKRYWFVYALVLAAAFAVSSAASRGVTAVETVMATEPVRSVVVIDAGHGGEDGGAVSCTGVTESSLNLSIAQKADALFKLLGVPTVNVRTEDVSVYSPEAQTLSEKKVSDLRNRVRLVEETPGALLLSIHQNTFPEGKYSGAQVFYAKNESSSDLAATLQQTIAAQLQPKNRRECKKANGIYLLEHVRCTGVLVECGFLSNPEEERLLRNEDYQKKLACAIVQGVLYHIRNGNGA